MKLIHLAESDEGLILLYEKSPQSYIWYTGDQPTIEADSLEEAIRLGWRHFPGFAPLLAGYRYTLPERDEHGNNALFSEMVASLNSPSGVYFDEKSGHNNVVHNIPQKAKNLYVDLKSKNLLERPNS